MFQQLHQLVNDPSFNNAYISFEDPEANANLNVNVNVTSNFNRPILITPSSATASNNSSSGSTWFNDFQDDLEDNEYLSQVMTQSDPTSSSNLPIKFENTDSNNNSEDFRGTRNDSISSTSSYESQNMVFDDIPSLVYSDIANGDRQHDQDQHPFDSEIIGSVTTSPESDIVEPMIKKEFIKSIPPAAAAAAASVKPTRRTRKRSVKQEESIVNSITSGVSSSKIKKTMTTIQRKAHNKIERKYRININSKIANLQKLVPWMSNENVAFEIDSNNGSTKGKKIQDEENNVKRLNKSMILDVVTKYLVHLKNENEMNIKKINDLKSELHSLKNE